MTWCAPVGSALCASLSALALAACSESAAPGDDPRANPGDAARVAIGARIYGRDCAACHGARLEGQANWRAQLPNGRLPAPPHDASGHTWHHPDRVLFRVTKEGMAWVGGANYQSDMPAFGGVLSDPEINAVIAFIKSSWPEPVRAQQQTIDQQDRQR